MLLVIAIAYWFAVRLGLLFVAQHGDIATIWPASGLALAILLLHPKSKWPQLLAVVFGVNVICHLGTGTSLPVSLCFATASSLEALLGAWVLLSLCKGEITFCRKDEVLALFGVAILCNGITAMVGAAGQALIEVTPFMRAWCVWWAADGLGILLVTPFVVAWCRSLREVHSLSLLRLVEAVVIILILAAFALVLFGPLTTAEKPVLRIYMLVPLLIWLALRRSPRSVTSALVALAIIAMWNTLHGYGILAFSDQTAMDRVEAVQICLMVMVLCGLFLSTVVADSRSANAALLESEEKYRILVDENSEPIFSLTRSGEYTYGNRALCEALDKQLDCVIGKTIQDVFPKEDADKRMASLEEVFITGRKKVIEGRVPRPDGDRHYETTIVPIKDAGGTVRSAICSARDITERKGAEAKLKEIDASLQGILQSTADGILAISKDGRVLFANDVFASLWKIPPDIMVTMNDALMLQYVTEQLMHPQIFLQKVKDLYASKELSFDTVHFKDGRVFERLSKPLMLGTELRGRVWSFRDITERKLAEEREKELQEKLERAKRMESLGILVGGVAHDLNNVLGPILLLPDLAADYLDKHGDHNDPKHADTLMAMQTMKEAGQRAAAVVSDLVMMGRRGQFQKAPVEVNRVVEEVLKLKHILALRARRPFVQISRQLSNEMLWCLGSEERLVRVLKNLLCNAAEAIDGQGDVTVRTGRHVFTVMHSGYEEIPAGEYITIEVTDTGCGMDARTFMRMFEPFFTTKARNERGGSGLGLSVVNGLVKDHSGYLDVESIPGKGSKFVVYLPAMPAGKAPPVVSGRVSLPGGNERILVVDDEPGQQMLALLQLKHLGYETTVVSSGEEAVALFDETRRNRKPAPFDLVLVDMMMKGLNGVGTCKTIRGLYPKQKLIIASGHAHEEHAKRIEELHIDWLAKPFTAHELASAVRAQLDRK